MKKIVICFIVCLSTTVNAGMIRSAVDATASSEISSLFDIGNTIDQSGLSSTYNSGFDDFDAYLASGPAHSILSVGFEWFSVQNIQSATTIFDLGSMYQIDAVALWVEESWAPHSDVSFLVSNDGIDFTPVLGGLSLPSNTGNYPATRFDFTAINARYFQIDFGNCSSSGCSLGEIAFSTENVSTVPAPTAFWLLGSGLIGFIGMRKKTSQLSEVCSH